MKITKKEKRKARKSILLLLIIFLPIISNFTLYQDLNTNQADERGEEVLIIEDNLQSSALLAEWTVMLYADGDCDLEEYIIDDMNLFERVGSSSKVKLCALFDRVSGFSNESGDWTGTRFYHNIQKDASENITSDYFDLGEVNMGDPDVLKQFIVLCKVYCPARNYVLILDDHGIGSWSGMQGVCSDHTNGGDYLTDEELGEAIEGIGIDVVHFATCSGGKIEGYTEVAFDCEVFLATQKVSYAVMQRYEIIYQELVDDPYMTAEELGALVVQTYADYVKNVPTVKGFTYVALRGNKIHNLTLEIEAFCDYMISNMNLELKGYIQEAFNASIFHKGRHKVDLVSFLDKLLDYAEDDYPELEPLVININNSYHEAIISEWDSGIVDYGGLFVYFPYDPKDYGYRYSNYLFCNLTGWDRFIKSYYAGHNPVKLAFLDAYYNNHAFQNASRINQMRKYENLIVETGKPDFFVAEDAFNKRFKVKLEGVTSSDVAIEFLNGNQFPLTPDNDLSTSSSIVKEFVNCPVDTIYLNITNLLPTDVPLNLSVDIPYTDDHYEENDAIENAADITGSLGMWETGLKALDEDWYTFTAMENQGINVSVHYDLASDGYPVVTLYHVEPDNSTDFITLDNGLSGIIDLSYINEYGDGAKFAVFVKNYFGHVNYNMSVNIAGGVDDYNEEDDDWASANQVMINDTYAALKCYDPDVYSVSLNAGEWIDACTTATYGELYVELHNQSGGESTLLRTINAIGPNESLSYQASQDINVSITIKPVSRRDVGFTYDFSITFGPNLYEDDWFEDQGGAQPTDNDYNTPKSNWYNISVDEEIAAIALDEDIYGFEVDNPLDVGIKLDYDNTDGDLLLKLYNGADQFIEVSYSAEENEYILNSLPMGYYYIVVDPISNFNINYNLSIYQNTQPHVSIDLDLSGGLSILLTGSISANLNTSQSIDWGDGNHEFWNPNQAPAQANSLSTSNIKTSATMSHVYTDYGTYNVTISVLEIDGDYIEISRVITISASSPPGGDSGNGISGYGTTFFLVAFSTVIIILSKKRKNFLRNK